MHRKSISYFIASRTAPILGLLIVTASIGLLMIANTIISRQIDSANQQYIDHFYKNATGNLKDIRNQVENIANNELIINSLVDPQNRESYITLFIRSFKLSDVERYYLAITNFSGTLIADNDFPFDLNSIGDSGWHEETLIDGDIVWRLNNKGLLIVAPIKLLDLPEGAVVAFVPIGELNNIFSADFINNDIYYLDDSDHVIYSSNPGKLAVGAGYRDSLFTGFNLSKRELEDNHRVILVEDKDHLYERIYLLVIFLLVSILVVLLGTSVSVFLSSRLISKTIKNFSDSLQKKKRLAAGEQEESTVDYDMPDELIDIQKQFGVLAEDLKETQLLKNNFQGILNSLNEYLVVLGPDGNTRMTNHAFERFMCDIESDEPRDFEKIVPKYLRDQVMDLTVPINDFECDYDIQPILFDAGDDETRTIRWARSLTYTDEDDFDGVIFVGVDVTEARLIQKELHLKNQAIEEASNGVVMIDALNDDFPLTYVNQAFTKITGYTRDEVIGRDLSFLRGEKTDVFTVTRIRRALRKHQSINETLLNYRKDGTETYIHTMLTPIRNDEHEVTHFLGIEMDVTTQVKAEIELRKAKVKAEESAQLKSEFLASMSHEIRTPMNGVLGMLGLLKQSYLNKQQSHYVGLAQSSAESLLTLINDILDFSKVEAGKMELELIDFHLPNMLGDFAESMAQRAEEKGLEIILDFSQVETDFVVGDPGRIRQILTNLVGNAIKFTSNGEIVIRVALQEESIHQLKFSCSVKDTGIGIPFEKQSRLFDSFSQVDASTTRKYGGTGLGLAIVKQLCHLMGGDVVVRSEEGKGSEFIFDIGLSVSQQRQAMLPKVDIAGTQILIVDDNQTNLEVLSTQLELWGAKVTEAGNADEALQCLNSAKEPFAIAILDMQMPETSGETLGKMIRENSEYDAMHLVMMTSISQRGDAKRLAKLGFSAFFPKPATANDLFDALNVLLDNSDALKTATPLLTRHHLSSLESLPTPLDSSYEAPEEPIHKKEDGMLAHLAHHRILLVEDNSVNQIVALGILEGLGLTATVAGNGLEALAALREAPEGAKFDMILMDCQMPEMDGYEATQAIRAGKAGNADIAIVAMTANAMKGDREKCLAAGMDDYLSKPIDPSKLQQRLRKWLAPEIQKTEDNPPNQAFNKEPQIMTDQDELVWDQDGFMRRIMNNETIAGKLIDLFKLDTPKTINSLEEAINLNEANEAGLLAHKLKGSVSNLGGVKFASLALKIEQAGRANDINEIKTLWPEVRPQYDQLMTAIEQGR